MSGCSNWKLAPHGGRGGATHLCKQSPTNRQRELELEGWAETIETSGRYTLYYVYNTLPKTSAVLRRCHLGPVILAISILCGSGKLCRAQDTKHMRHDMQSTSLGLRRKPAQVHLQVLLIVITPRRPVFRSMLSRSQIEHRRRGRLFFYSLLAHFITHVQD